GPADALEHLLLEDAQQLGLQLERQVADLVEEERAAVRELETPDALGDGARERAALVPEELALQQAGGNGGAVDRDEGALAALSRVVDGPRDQLLAGSGLAQDEHRRAGRRDGLHLMEYALQRGRPSHDLLEVVLGAELLLEVDLLGGELVLQ